MYAATSSSSTSSTESARERCVLLMQEVGKAFRHFNGLLLIPLTLQDVDIDTRAKSQRATTLSVGNDSIREYATEILSALTQRR